MDRLFLQIFNLSISASYLILAVIAVRFLLRKAPKNICCILWFLVGIRLVFPFSVESIFSLVPSKEVVSEEALYAPQPVIHSGIPVIDRPVNTYLSENAVSPVEDSANKLQVVTGIFSILWLIGVVGMLLYLIISWIRLKHSVRLAVPVEVTIDGKQTRIYQSDNIASPFLFGLIKPRIYIPYSVEEQDMPFIVLHEKAHIRRRDYLIKPIGFLILTVYWFNPFVWLAYVLLCRDIELACDERVIRSVGIDCKKAYSQALLTCAVNRRTIAACPVAFGEAGVKERIKNVLNYKKPAFWVIVAAAAACIAVCVCFMTQKKAENSNQETVEEQTTEQVLSEEAVTEEQETGQSQITAASDEKDNLALVEEWALAFCRRDAVNVTNVITDEVAQSFVERGMLDYGVTDDGRKYANWGWSSPWPWGPDDSWSEEALQPNYRIISLTDYSAEILYYAWVSDPHVTVWHEQIDYEIDNGNFVITSENLYMMDAICVAEEFYSAYPGGDIDNTPMDYYRGNGAGEALNNNAKNNRDSKWYAKLFSPDTAAVYLLNILDNENKVETEVYYSQVESGVAVVAFNFLEDGSSASVMMLQPYGKEGIWVPRTNKLMSTGRTPNYSENYQLIDGQNIDERLQSDAALLERLFPNHHEVQQETVQRADLNGDGIEEEIAMTNLGYNGGDGGYAISVTSSGKEIPMPDGYDSEMGFEFWCSYDSSKASENDDVIMDIYIDDTLLASITQNAMSRIWRNRNIDIKQINQQIFQKISGDAVSGFTVITLPDEKKPVLILKSYLSGVLGHIDCIGYGITELRLNDDNTWDVKYSFILEEIQGF